MLRSRFAAGESSFKSWLSRLEHDVSLKCFLTGAHVEASSEDEVRRITDEAKSRAAASPVLRRRSNARPRHEGDAGLRSLAARLAQ